jgi:hypothetical protein
LAPRSVARVAAPWTMWVRKISTARPAPPNPSFHYQLHEEKQKKKQKDIQRTFFAHVCTQLCTCTGPSTPQSPKTNTDITPKHSQTVCESLSVVYLNWQPCQDKENLQNLKLPPHWGGEEAGRNNESDRSKSTHSVRMLAQWASGRPPH